MQQNTRLCPSGSCPEATCRSPASTCTQVRLRQQTPAGAGSLGYTHQSPSQRPSRQVRKGALLPLRRRTRTDVRAICLGGTCTPAHRFLGLDALQGHTTGIPRLGAGLGSCVPGIGGCAPSSVSAFGDFCSAPYGLTPPSLQLCP